MALFGTKKNTKEPKKAAEAKETSVKTVVASSALRGIYADIILRPRITEKSGIMNETNNVYTFEVRRNATKPMIAASVKALYKVVPAKVRVINLPAKRVLVRGKRGTTNAVKKALVYLKKGDKIDLA